MHNGTDIPQPDNEMHGDQKAPELQQPLLPSSPSHSEQQTVHDTIITQTTLGAVQVPQTVSQQPPQTIPLQQQAVSPQPQTLPTIPSQMVPLEPQTVSPQPQVISPQPQTLPIYPLQPQIVPLAPQIQQSMVPQVQQQVPPQQDVMLMVKRVTIGKRSISIVLQNINGPCPLIALANALILRGINFPDIHANVNYVSLDRLVEMLAGYLLENCSVCFNSGIFSASLAHSSSVHSLTYPLAYSSTHLPTCSFTCSLTYQLVYPLTAEEGCQCAVQYRRGTFTVACNEDGTRCECTIHKVRVFHWR